MIAEFLKNQGFNRNDEKVYLDIYEHGQSFASTVAARTKVDRTTVYSTLKRLLKRGVIVQTKVNDVLAYVAVSPEVFVDEVEGRISSLVAEKKMASLFVEELKSVKKSSFVKPKIRLYEGDQSIITLYEETLRKGGQQKAFIKINRLPEVVRDFFRGRYVEAKKKYGVFSRVITADTAFAKRYQAGDREANRRTKIVKKHPFDLHAEIVLFGESEVAIVDFHKQIYGIVIDSETLYKTIEAVFDFIWEEVN